MADDPNTRGIARIEILMPARLLTELQQHLHDFDARHYEDVQMTVALHDFNLTREQAMDNLEQLSPALPTQVVKQRPMTPSEGAVIARRLVPKIINLLKTDATDCKYLNDQLLVMGILASSLSEMVRNGHRQLEEQAKRKFQQ